jgi:hypothetical protein
MVDLSMPCGLAVEWLTAESIVAKNARFTSVSTAIFNFQTLIIQLRKIALCAVENLSMVNCNFIPSALIYIVIF